MTTSVIQSMAHTKPPHGGFVLALLFLLFLLLCTYMHFTIGELPEEIAVQCPHCNVIHSRGCVVVETVVDGEPYVYAELVTCCNGTVQPIPFLFDSHEPAQSYVCRFNKVIRTLEDFFSAGFVKKALIF